MTATGSVAADDEIVETISAHCGWTKSMYRWCEYALTRRTSVASHATTIGFVVFQGRPA